MERKQERVGAPWARRCRVEGETRMEEGVRNGLEVSIARGM